MKNKFNIGDRVVDKTNGSIFKVEYITISTSDNIYYSNHSRSGSAYEDNLELYKEKKKITLYRHTFESNGYFFQSSWNSNEIHIINNFEKKIKTETKDIEVNDE